MNEIKLPDGIYNPQSFTVSPFGEFYITDQDEHKVFSISSEGALTGQFGKHGSGVSQLDTPGEIITMDGINVYVLDYFNNRIQRLNKRLEIVSSIGKSPMESFSQVKGESIGRPKSMTISQRGDIFYIDEENNEIKKINSTGILDSRFSSKINLNAPELIRSKDNYIFIAKKKSIYKYDYFGGFITELKINVLKTIDDLAIDEAGNFYALDKTSRHILKLNSNGQFIKAYLELELDKPVSLYFLKNQLYVLDSGRRSIIVLSQDE